MSVMALLIGILLCGAAVGLMVTAQRDTNEWREHRRQVQAKAAWQAEVAKAPYDHSRPAPPTLTSPYAVGDDPPPLPAEPGMARMIWAGIIGVAGAMTILAGLLS